MGQGTLSPLRSICDRGAGAAPRHGGRLAAWGVAATSTNPGHRQHLSLPLVVPSPERQPFQTRAAISRDPRVPPSAARCRVMDEEAAPQPVSPPSMLGRARGGCCSFAVRGSDSQSNMQRRPRPQVWEGPLDDDGLPHGQVPSCGRRPLLHGRQGLAAAAEAGARRSVCSCGRPRVPVPAGAVSVPLLPPQGKMTYPPPPVTEEGEEERPGDSYTGSMQHGVRHGRGRYAFGGGPAVYEGDYFEWRREGRGTMRFPDGSSYDGARAAEGRYSAMPGTVAGARAALALVCREAFRPQQQGPNAGRRTQSLQTPLPPPPFALCCSDQASGWLIRWRAPAPTRTTPPATCSAAASRPGARAAPACTTSRQALEGSQTDGTPQPCRLARRISSDGTPPGAAGPGAAARRPRPHPNPNAAG